MWRRRWRCSVYIKSIASEQAVARGCHLGNHQKIREIWGVLVRKDCKTHGLLVLNVAWNGGGVMVGASCKGGGVAMGRIRNTVKMWTSPKETHMSSRSDVSLPSLLVLGGCLWNLRMSAGIHFHFQPYDSSKSTELGWNWVDTPKKDHSYGKRQFTVNLRTKHCIFNSYVKLLESSPEDVMAEEKLAGMIEDAARTTPYHHWQWVKQSRSSCWSSVSMGHILSSSPTVKKTTVFGSWKCHDSWLDTFFPCLWIRQPWCSPGEHPIYVDWANDGKRVGPYWQPLTRVQRCLSLKFGRWFTH